MAPPPSPAARAGPGLAVETGHFWIIGLDFNALELNNFKARFNIIEVRAPVAMAISAAEATRPAWVEVMDEEDLRFLWRFLMSSGSLKALAEDYKVSYPTVRARLDRLIAKAKAAEEPKVVDPFERAVRVMVADGKLDPALARGLLDAHRLSLEGRSDR